MLPFSRKRKPSSARRLFVTPAKKVKTVIPRSLRGTNTIRTNVEFGRGPIPARAWVWLRYRQAQTSGAADKDRVYNLNSIFDPDETGGAHKPLGYDQYNTFFNRYRVWGVRVRVTFAPKPSVTSSQFVVGISGTNSISAVTDIDNALEQAGASSRVVSPQAGPVTLTKYFLLRRIVGQSIAQYKDDRFQALMSTNPAERIGLHVLFGTATGGVAGDTVLDYRVDLDYRVELFDPHIVAGSN